MCFTYSITWHYLTLLHPIRNTCALPTSCSHLTKPLIIIREKPLYFIAAVNKLETMLGIPPPRRCHGAVQINTENGTQVFIAGGHDGENVFDDLWRLDLKTFQWTYFDKCRLPFPIYFHAAAATPEGRLYIFGGICSNNDNDVRRSNCMYSTWLCIPKLSEICWEAVLHYSPHIVDCKSEDLINVGLPRHYVQRLGNNTSPSNREQ